VGQIDKLYTQDLRKAIVNACGNSLLFAVSDPDTAKYLSEKIGETQSVFGRSEPSRKSGESRPISGEFEANSRSI
jgi:type IV secretory pathway TraG/TraD family ATPase VirD4